VFLLGISQADRWRRLWLRTEDPRALGLFRVLFAAFVLLNVGGLWEHFTFLFTDEGIFSTDTARELLAREQFAGYGDGAEPAGFFDARAVARVPQGPEVLAAVVLGLAAAFALHFCRVRGGHDGVHARLAHAADGRARLVGMHSITLRNPLFMEGTDLVYSCMFFYLILSQCGRAYSVDNWLRCRRLAREGRLSLPGGPGDGAGVAPSPAHPRGLAAIYRRVPAWPRLLMMLQLATIYVYGGCAKNGDVWLRGDSLYYALNMDHFYRVPPQYLSAIFGTNLFRLMTWVVHIWQAAFPLVVVGLVVRWALRERLPRLAGARLWLVRGLWIALGGLALTIAEVALPRALPRRSGQAEPAHGAAGCSPPAGSRHGPHRLACGGACGTARSTCACAGGRTRLDLEWFCGWFLGRRVFLTIGILFHGHLLVLMNIGMFAPIMLLTYMVFLSGPELASILRDPRPRRSPASACRGSPHDVRAGAPPIPTEDPRLPHLHRDAARLPVGAMLVSLALGTGAIVLAGLGLPGARACVASALLALFAGSLVAWRRDGRRARSPPTGATAARPIARGPTARGAVPGRRAGRLSHHRGRGVVHARQAVPQDVPRGRARAVPPVADAHAHGPGLGDVRPEPAAPQRVPQGAGDRRGGRGPRHAHGHVRPRAQAGPVDLQRPDLQDEPAHERRRGGQGRLVSKVVRPLSLPRVGAAARRRRPQEGRAVQGELPDPQPRRGGPQRLLPARGQLAKFSKEERLHTTTCASEPEAQLSDVVRARHGLPPLPAGAYKPWNKNRRAHWADRTKKNQEKAP
jgi:hypothetical protein